MSSAATSTPEAAQVGSALGANQLSPALDGRLLAHPVDTCTHLTTFNTRPDRPPRPQNPASAIGSAGDNANNKASRPSRRFAPQLIATSTSNRIRGRKMSDIAKRPPPRRFTPQLIETDKRSFSNGSASRIQPRFYNGVANNVVCGNKHSLSYPEQSRHSFESLRKRQEDGFIHEDYYQPSLPAIDSDNSEEEREEEEDKRNSRRSRLYSCSSRKRSDRISETHRRESCDDSVSKYLLSLAHEAVEKQVMNTTLATFPTEQVNHSVTRFAASDERSIGSVSSEHVRDTKHIIDNLDVDVHSDPKDVAAQFRRNSLVDIGYEISQLRKSKEECERRAKEKKLSSRECHESAGDAKRQEDEEQKVINNAIRKKQEASEFDKLKLLEPPMMGDDIVFPQCLSPQTTSCTPDQLPQPGFFRLDENQRYNDEHDSAPLWQRAGPGSSSPKPTSPAGGLWNGLCKKTSDHNNSATRSRYGFMTPALVTPALEQSDPFQSHATAQNNQMSCFSGMSHLPTTPPASNPTTPPPEGIDMMDIDTDDFRRRIGCSRFDTRRRSLFSVEDREARIVSEFPDSFVSQIYDYLSLGYPSLARNFDAELSKISKFPIELLRLDDKNTDAQGYVVPPVPSPKPEDCFSLRRFPNKGVGSQKVDFDDLVEKRKCMRWCALRLYIREWARQQSSWLDDDRDRTELMKLRSIPAPPRKGSWAV